MKRVYKYIALQVIMLGALGCVNSEFTPDVPSAESGDEVKFGLSLPNLDTKTVYGEESDSDTFPIYWVDGDKVRIFSPQCLEGRRSAEYKVILPDNVAYPNYAKDLVRTGEYGVQWGEANTADFYSLYPSGNYGLSEKGDHATGITISYNQNIVVNGDDIQSDMEDCLLYASTTGVLKGNVVNLNYKPISTVIRVELTVETGTGVNTDEFTIQSVSLIADTQVAGTFSIDIENGDFVQFESGKSSSTVMTQITNPSTGGFHTIKNGDSFDVPLFLAPVPELNVNAWKIQVVANNKTYTKTLGLDMILEPGQIHKIKMPTLKPTTTEWDTGKWMERIPRNVYLSEVSIPGSWNSLNKEFQAGENGTDISTQYKNGVRAFHIDTRWKYVSNTYTLGTADGGSTANQTSLGSGKVMTDANNPEFATSLSTITSKVSDQEYMVVLCTFAQDSYPYVDNNGDDWIDAISKACDANNKVFDAKFITPSTLVGDVLGKVIVIVNVGGTNSGLPSDSKCLFTNIPMQLDKNTFETNLFSDIKNTNTTQSDTGIDLYYTHAQISVRDNDPGVNKDRSNLDSRGFAPTDTERQRVASSILEWSKNNYADKDHYTHSNWIYLGLGGYYFSYTDRWLFGGWNPDNDSHDEVAKEYSEWIDSKISEMGKNGVNFYPVGLVYLNYANTYSSTLKNILLLNNKYQMQYDSDKPTDYTPAPKSRSDYGATASNGGNVILMD